MANFELVKDITIQLEGGYSFVQSDLGGETKYGISKRSYPNVDIKNLSKDEAFKIYKRDFWDAIRLDELEDQQLANQIFLYAINCGIGTAVKSVQEVLNKIGYKCDVDGRIGNQTLHGLNRYIISNKTFNYWFYDALKVQQIQRYASIVSRIPSQRINLPGWLHRTFKT